VITEQTIDGWPSLNRTSTWRDTGDYLHLVSQMLGKLSLALAPALPEWFHVPLSVTPRGLATDFLTSGDRPVQAELDVVDELVRMSVIGGAQLSVPISPARPIAQIWRDFNDGLSTLGVTADMWDRPQERDDVVPFAEDDRPRQFDQAVAIAWVQLLSDVHATFNEWRSPFFGRSGINFWWGGFDMTVGLYTGRPATPPATANFIRRYDLDAEHLNIGFWPGDSTHDAMFFGYLVPEPPGCEAFAFDIDDASWAPSMSEWVIPYDVVLRAQDRRATLRTFADTIYRAAGHLGGWDLKSFAYAVAPPSTRGGGR
jgi:hypothetical protein